MAVVAEHEGGDTDPSGSAGLRGHLNTPSVGSARPPPSRAKHELDVNRNEDITKTSVVVLSNTSSGAFQHRGRKVVSSRPK